MAHELYQTTLKDEGILYEKINISEDSRKQAEWEKKIQEISIAKRKMEKTFKEVVSLTQEAYGVTPIFKSHEIPAGGPAAGRNGHWDPVIIPRRGGKSIYGEKVVAPGGNTSYVGVNFSNSNRLVKR